MTLIQKIKIKSLNRKRKCRWMKPGSETNFHVQHIINMRLEDNWIQAPRDVEVWIGKHKIVRVRYTAPRQRSVIDSEAVALRLREKQGMRSSRARAIRWAYKKKRAKPLQEIFWTKRKMMNPFHAKLLSLTRNGLGE